METQKRRIPWSVIALAVILIAYAAFLRAHFAAAISEPDDNGYFAQATLLADTGRTWFRSESDAQYIGMHWLVTPSEQYISRYPPGLPVLIGIVYKIAGYKASLLVNPALSIFALIGLYALCRQLVSSGWSLAAVLLLASNPNFVHHALACDSHMAVTFCVAWGMYLLMRWSSQGRLWQALLAGLVIGCIPTIRYPDSVMGLGVAVFLLWHWRKFPRIIWHYALFLAGAMMPILPLLVRNQLLLGAFWRTGYALTNEQTGFSWAYFREHALQYIQEIHGNGMGLMFALGIVGIVTMICIRPARALGIMLSLVTVPMLLLYMAYYWAPQMNGSATMRFLVPTFPAYILAGVWAMSICVQQSPRAAKIALPIVIVALQMLWGVNDLRDETNRIQYQKEMLARVTDSLDGIAQPGDVIVSDNEILQQLDFVRRWKLADRTLVRGGPGGPGGGPGGGGFGGPGGGMRGGPMGQMADADAPSPMQREKREEQSEKYPGTPIQRERKFAADIAAWAGGHKVYVVGSEQQLMQSSSDGSDGSLHIIARVQMPDAPVMEGRGGFGGPGGGPGGGMRGRGFDGPGGGGGMGFGGPDGGGGPPGGIAFNGPGGGVGFGGGPGAGGFAGGRRGGPGGGGPMGQLNGEKEIIIAQWTIPS